MTAREPEFPAGGRTGMAATGQGVGQILGRAASSPLSLRGAVVEAVLLCWPMLLVTAPIGQFETASHHNGSGDVVARLAGMLGMAPGAVEAATGPDAGAAIIMPKRLPPMLARSLADGPGARCLDQACAQSGGAAETLHGACEVVPDRPSDLGGFLWTGRGIGGLTDDEFDRVRSGEGRLPWDIFRTHPAEQAWAFLRNAAQQVAMVGTGEIQPLVVHGTPEGRTFETTAGVAEPDLVLRGPDVILSLLVAALARRPFRDPAGRQDRDMAPVCVPGLLGNALIFEGSQRRWIATSRAWPGSCLPSAFSSGSGAPSPTFAL